MPNEKSWEVANVVPIVLTIYQAPFSDDGGITWNSILHFKIIQNIIKEILAYLNVQTFMQHNIIHTSKGVTIPFVIKCKADCS